MDHIEVVVDTNAENRKVYHRLKSGNDREKCWRNRMTAGRRIVCQSGAAEEWSNKGVNVNGEE